MEWIKKFMHQPWLYLVIVLFGTSLKFYKLGYSVFWYDEVATVMHTSGNQIFDIPENDIINIKFYNDQFHLKNQNQSIFSQLKGLFSQVNLNPLHYSFLMVWYRIAGDDIISYRLFNVFIFILTLPALFLLAKTLFKSNLAGWIIVSLYAISPYFHFHVQEARYNTLLAFLIILLHYLLLRAISHKNLKWWAAYVLMGILTLYTSVLSGLIIFGHFIYIIFFKKENRFTYSISLVIILLGYLPWIIVLINNSQEITSSLAWHSTMLRHRNDFLLFLRQCFGFTSIFSMFTSRYGYFFYFRDVFLIKQILDIIIFILISFSIFYTIKNWENLHKKSFTFCFTQVF